MKKLLALTLSLLMVFAIMPMAMIASADDDTYTTTLDFDTTLTSPSFGFVNGGTGEGKNQGGVVDYTTIDETYTDGKVMWLNSVTGTYNNYGFYIGSVLKDKKVKSISFTIWADKTINFQLNTRTGLGNGNMASILIKAETMGVSSMSASTTPKTITYDLSGITSYKSYNNASLIFCQGIKSTNLYIDNIIITYEKFAGTFTGGTDGDQLVYADEAGLLTTPSATLAEGEFAGWVTEAAAENVIPAGTQLTITDDTTYYAVSATRDNQDAPEAPTVDSITSTSVTLVANSAYQYSIDKVTWQSSNVFSGLSPATEYTFYQRLKATPTKYASPASEGTTIETSIVYKWNLYSSNFTKNSDATLAGGFNTQYQNDGTYFVSQNNAVGATATLTSIATVKPGIYSAKLYARTSGARASIDVLINGTKVASALNTYTNNGLDVAFELSENTVTVTEESQIELTITTTTTGNLFLNSLELEKIADYVNPEAAPTTDAIVTDVKASIRLNEVNGIRFYTAVDEEKLSELVGDETYEIGTLIAPADLLGDDNELTIDDTCLDVKYTSSKYYEGTTFVGSIVNIRETEKDGDGDTNGNIDRDFVGRGYVKIGDTYYYSSTTSTRSLAEVAAAYQAEIGEGVNELVDKWAAEYTAE